MSSLPPVNEDFTAPPYLSSGAVAIITVIAVLVAAGLVVAGYYLYTSWKLNNNLQREKSIGFEEVPEEGGDPQPERLREDTVVVHDLLFHDDSVYSVSPSDKPEPSPAPSIFQENALLQEILSSVEAIGKTEEPSSPVLGIIDDVIENIVVHSSSSQVETQSEEDEGGRRCLIRNESYHRAIEDDEHNQGMFEDCNTFLSSHCSGSNCATVGNSEQLEMSEFSSQSKEKYGSVASLEASIEDGGDCEIRGKCHSTPILDGPQSGDSVPVSQSRYLSYLNLDSAVKEGYIPVYNRPYPSFIKPSTQKMNNQ
jgi:hypothetical protein